MPDTDDYERMRKAELLLELKSLRERLSTSASLEKTIHELRVHQEEVEIQNAQLAEMQAALEESRERYADLYDFAPVPYITLDPYGIIREINLAGAHLLRAERGRLIGIALINYIAPANRRG